MQTFTSLFYALLFDLHDTDDSSYSSNSSKENLGFMETI